MRLSAFSVALLLLAGPELVVADDLDDALAALKQAEPSKDVAKIKQLAAAVHAAALKMQAPGAADATDKEAFDARVAYAKEQDVYSEYALFALAVQSQPAVELDLIAAIEKQNPKSKYLDEPETLEFEAENALGKNQLDRALGFANRLIAVGNRKPPEGEAAASWEARRNTALSRGYWTAGVIQGQKQLFKDADRNLRAALPLIKGNNAMMGPALFFLGVANYNIAKITLNKAKMLEAVKFSQDCAAIQGPYQDNAYKNALQIKSEADRMR